MEWSPAVSCMASRRAPNKLSLSYAAVCQSHGGRTEGGLGMADGSSGWPSSSALCMSGGVEVEESADLLVSYQLTAVDHLLPTALARSLHVSLHPLRATRPVN